MLMSSQDRGEEFPGIRWGGGTPGMFLQVLIPKGVILGDFGSVHSKEVADAFSISVHSKDR